MSLPSSGKEAVTSPGSSERLAHLACLAPCTWRWDHKHPVKNGSPKGSRQIHVQRSGMPSCTRAQPMKASKKRSTSSLGGPLAIPSGSRQLSQKRSKDSHQARTSEEYRHKLELFKAFCAAQKLPQRKAADVDWALLLFVHQAFLEGWDVRTLCTSRSPSNSQSHAGMAHPASRSHQTSPSLGGSSNAWPSC